MNNMERRLLSASALTHKRTKFLSLVNQDTTPKIYFPNATHSVALM